MRKCTKCGLESDRDVQLCPWCGAQTVETRPTPPGFRELYRKNVDEANRKREEKERSEPIAPKLQSTLKQLLQPGETVELSVRGGFKEALICTDRRVIILKTGFMTGQLFGANVFQVPYSQVTGAQVEFHLSSGFFQLSAAGMQNLPRSYWSMTTNITPREACNCVSIVGDIQAKIFRDASSFIMNKLTPGPRVETQAADVSESDQVIKAIRQLGQLKDAGTITPEESRPRNQSY